MGRRNEKIRRDEVSCKQKTPTVSDSLRALIATHHLPLTSNIPVNTCLYLTSASVWVNTAHSCSAYVQTRPPQATSGQLFLL